MVVVRETWLKYLVEILYFENDLVNRNICIILPLIIIIIIIMSSVQKVQYNFSIFGPIKFTSTLLILSFIIHTFVFSSIIHINGILQMGRRASGNDGDGGERISQRKIRAACASLLQNTQSWRSIVSFLMSQVFLSTAISNV